MEAGNMARRVRIKKGMPSTSIDKAEFAKRFPSRFYDPVFEGATQEIERLIDKAWDGYKQYRKSPRTRRAGRGFADPEFELPLEWLATRDRIRQAEKQHKETKTKARILLINGSSRTERVAPVRCLRPSASSAWPKRFSPKKVASMWISSI
jgi:hypothetical protein